MEIDRLARQVIDSLRPLGNGPSRIEKQAMKRLLELGDYRHERKRDLDVFYRGNVQNALRAQFIVLDNDLAVYETTMEDVVLRKSPYVKEMVSIRNIIKILNDGDVIRCKKADTVRLVHGECLSLLDLSVNPSDLSDMRNEAIKAVTSGDTEKVLTCISLFAELLEYVFPPPFLAFQAHHIRCGITIDPVGVHYYGPHVIYDSATNRLALSILQIKNGDKDKIETIQQVMHHTVKPDKAGADVFTFLFEAASGITSIPATTL
ncbi:MAG: hypothetical protein ACOZF0_06910 [Thermodesulfobacteriota bacterium]